MCADGALGGLGAKEFNECWRKTEVIREYKCLRYTFGDMELPYVFATEHNRFRDRTVLWRGVILKATT